MTAVYFDTGVLAKIYCPEQNSSLAISLLQRYRPPLPFTHWQEIEMRNAIRLKVFRKEMTSLELKHGLHHLQTDINNGLLKRPVYHLADVMGKAENLSHRYAAETGCRTLDILHVAAALIIGAREFITFDKRQGELARLAGLKVTPNL